MEMEAVLNDTVVIPERIKAMSKEQREAEIKRLEHEAEKKKQELLSGKKPQ